MANEINYSDLLAQRKYNPNVVPESEQVILTIQSKVIGTLQNYVVFSGLPKNGKSTYISATIASAIVPNFQDCFGIKLKTPKDRPKIAYFDTESSSYDFHKQIKRITEFAYGKFPDKISAFNTREDSPGRIRNLIVHYLESNPDCSIVIVDGFLDLCLNYNDEKETRLLTNWFKKITKKFNILLIGVLHLGKGQGETLGHLGSNTDRWSQSTLIVEKNKETKQFVLKAKFLRSSEEFEPIALMNFDGKFQQVPYEKPTIENYKKPKK
jgi:hypothetical protein